MFSIVVCIGLDYACAETSQRQNERNDKNYILFFIITIQHYDTIPSCSFLSDAYMPNPGKDTFMPICHNITKARIGKSASLFQFVL
jgi:hypothetical protein